MITSPAIAYDLFSPQPALAVPAVAPAGASVGRMPLRYCQLKDVNALLHAHSSGYKRMACVGATGYGRSVVIAELVGRLLAGGAGKVLALIDRAHLVHQLAAEIERHLPSLVCGRVADGTTEGLSCRVVVATVQSMYTPDRKGRPLYEYQQFRGVGAVILDEGHRFFAECFRAIANHFADLNGARIFGLTATPAASSGAA